MERFKKKIFILRTSILTLILNAVSHTVTDSNYNISDNKRQFLSSTKNIQKEFRIQISLNYFRYFFFLDKKKEKIKSYHNYPLSLSLRSWRESHKHSTRFDKMLAVLGKE